MKSITIGILGFLITSVVVASEGISEDTASLLSQYDKDTLTQISNELVKLAHEEELEGEYALSAEHYARAIAIRSAIGMQSHSSSAPIHLLSSVAHGKAGKFCEASLHAKKASELFRNMGNEKFTLRAKAEEDKHAKACAVFALKS